MATPLMIQIALHYHCRPDDFGDSNGDNNFRMPLVQQILKEFVDAGLLRPNDDTLPSDRKFYATAGLTAWVDALCAVPLPIQQWIISKDTGAQP